MDPTYHYEFEIGYELGIEITKPRVSALECAIRRATDYTSPLEEVGLEEQRGIAFDPTKATAQWLTSDTTMWLGNSLL